MKNIWKWISKNQGVCVAVIICLVLMIWTFSCESQVSSLIDPSKMINAAELELEIETESVRLLAELETLAKRGKLKQDEIAKKEALKKELMDFAAISATSGGFNPSGLVTLAFSILGFGAVVDNRIKDKVIKNRPLPASVPPGAEVTS